MRFERIDQLRGFAALAVVVCHFAVSAYKGAPNAGEPFLPGLGLVLGFGYLGVPLFFVISGFCIHFPNARALAAAGRVEPAWGPFFRRRFWRLYPPYVAAIALAVVLALVATGTLPVSWPAVVCQALLLHTLHPATFDGVNPPAWTLGVEAQLYLAYPVVLWLIVRRRAWRALAVALAVTMAYRLFLNFDPMPAPFGGVAWEFVPARWFEWVLGAVVAEWVAGNAPMPAIARRWWAAAIVLAAAISIEWHTWHYGLYAIKEPLYGIAFALVLVVALDRARRAGGADRVASTRIGRYLAGVGIWSYSLYLVHRPIQLAFEPLVRRVATWPVVIESGFPSSLVLMAATTPVVLWAARLFHRRVEAPCIAVAQRAGRPRTRVATDVAGSTGSLATGTGE
ncbi:MAG TPA: acyltransferase [Candidatus Binatia bacterium]|nr:acyltransferase [Candidatus Binatia bacterium]